MAQYDDIDSYCDRLIELSEAWEKRIVEVITEEWERVPSEIYAAYGDFQRERITAIFNRAVTEFYDAYRPKQYQRSGDSGSQKGGLYNLLALHANNDGVISYDEAADLVSASKLPHGSLNGYIFDIVFKEGWHGGATKIAASKVGVWGNHPSPGAPYYRKPGFIPHERSASGRRIWHQWGDWGRSAVKSASPLKVFDDELLLAEAEGGEFDKKFEEIVEGKVKDFYELVQNDLVPKVDKEIYG